MSDPLNNEQITTLIGKEARVYKTGDILTEDYKADRVNIELSKNKEIIQIWMG